MSKIHIGDKVSTRNNYFLGRVVSIKETKEGVFCSIDKLEKFLEGNLTIVERKEKFKFKLGDTVTCKCSGEKGSIVERFDSLVYGVYYAVNIEGNNSYLGEEMLE